MPFFAQQQKQNVSLMSQPKIRRTQRHQDDDHAGDDSISSNEPKRQVITLLFYISLFNGLLLQLDLIHGLQRWNMLHVFPC